MSSNSTNGLAKATSPLLLSWRYYVILVSKKVSFSHGGIALFSCLKSHFLFNSGLPHIWTGVALLFGSSQSRLSEGASCYIFLWIRCNTTPCFNVQYVSRIFSNITPCFNFLEFSSATTFSPSPIISSQFQQLFSCSLGSRRRRRTMGSSSPYPVEGGKTYLWLKSFYL